MIFGAALISNAEEEKRIRGYLSEFTAYYTDENINVRSFSQSRLLISCIREMDLLDVAIVDVTLPGALDAARRVRKKFPNAEMLVIADVSISPMEYMHPSIRASSLVLRPAGPVWKKAVHDFFAEILKENVEENQKNVLWVENRSGVFRIPFEQICYLEAREKKVFIRTRMEEFGISGTIEKLAEQLPKNFIRCHRSFIVNIDYIYKVRMSENMIYLKGDMFVPVSRGCRAGIKEAFK